MREGVARLERVTKEEITRLEGATARPGGTIREEVVRLEGIIRESFAEIRTAISQSEARKTRWVIGLMAGSIAATAAIAVFIQRLTGG